MTAVFFPVMFESISFPIKNTVKIGNLRQYWVVAILVFGKPDYFINDDILLSTNVGNMKLLVHSINTYQEFSLFLALFTLRQDSSEKSSS